MKTKLIFLHMILILLALSFSSALADIGPDAIDALPALDQVLGNAEPPVRDAAAEALGLIDKKRFPL